MYINLSIALLLLYSYTSYTYTVIVNKIITASSRYSPISPASSLLSAYGSCSRLNE